MATEVTAGLYRALMGELDEQPPWSTTPDHPAVIVTWDEAEAFCEKAGGRLPTEAEWEYAARGGREGAIYPWGDETPADKPGAPNGAALESDRPRPVKSYKANGYGLFDIAGNVWEWTADVGTLYRDEARIDPHGRGRRVDAHRARRVVRRRPRQPARLEPDSQPSRPRQRERRVPLRPRAADRLARASDYSATGSCSVARRPPSGERESAIAPP